MPQMRVSERIEGVKIYHHAFIVFMATTNQKGSTKGCVQDKEHLLQSLLGATYLDDYDII